MSKTKDKFFGQLESLSEKNQVEEVEASTEEVSEAVEETNVVETTEVNNVTVTPTFNSVCLGLARDASGKIRLFEIPYDSELMIAGEVICGQEEFLDGNHAQEAFKIAVVKKGLFR